jgi:hypothetical protein
MTPLLFDRASRVACRLCVALGAVALLVPAPRASTVVPPAFPSLVGQADYIIRAVVKSVSSEIRTDQYGRHIFTKVELDVRQVISGTPPQPLVLQMLGGKVGDETMVVQGAPTFKVGDEDILFIRGNGQQFTPLVALMHGRYPILADTSGREYVARSNGAALYDEQEVALPMGAASTVKMSQPNAQPLSPAYFVGRIQNAISQNSRQKLEN